MSEVWQDEPDDALAEAGQVILYGHVACLMVPPVRSTLRLAKVAYTYVDIRRDAAGRQRVREINNGHESVPTLEFPDGSTLTEPPAGILHAKLRAMGYHVPFTAVITSNIHWIIVGLGVLWAVLTSLEVL